MYLGDLVGVLLRRWFGVVVGISLTLAAGAYVTAHVGRDYQASGQTVLLLAPDVYSSQVRTNPYLTLQGGLDTLAALTASDVMSEDTEKELQADGYEAEYDVAVNPGTGPLLVVTTVSKDPSQAVSTRDEVLRRIADVVAELQAGLDVPEHQVAAVHTSNVSVGAEVLPGSRLRALMGTVASGGILVALLVFALDNLGRRRRRRGALPVTARTAEPSGADRTGEEVLTP